MTWYLGAMDKQLHPDAAAIDRLGFPRIKAHFNISRQAFHYWRANGVPKMHRNTLVLLGRVNGVQMTEMDLERGRTV